MFRRCFLIATVTFAISGIGAVPAQTPIDQKYAELGGSQGFLGQPVTEERVAPDGVGHYRHYQNGSIYWSPQTGAHEIHGAIRDKWASLGWERGFLGYPLTDEMGTPDGVGRFNHFQGGYIYWTPERGAYAAVSPGSAIIDFENVAPGLVFNQYASLGVTFNNLTVRDYANGFPYFPGFAHSGAKAAEQCYGVEFCARPIEMSFTRAQRRVKVWVGYSSRLNESRMVILRAFDAGGALVGQAATTLNPSPTLQAIRFPLEVALANSTIRRAVVSFSSSAMLMNSLAIDDVEFDAVGTAPPCSSARNPTATLSQPTDGQTVQFNEFMLEGAVSTDDPLATITVTITGSGGASRTILFPPSTRALGPTRMNEYLYPGLNTITLKAQDCGGVTQSNRTVFFAPIAEGTRFVFMGMEITQAVQNLNNDVPLIAGKQTVARVYLRLQSPGAATAAIYKVGGFLSAHRGGAVTPGPLLSPGRLYSQNTITVDSSTDILAKRRDINASLNFDLPPEWTEAGDVQLVFRPEIEGSPSSPSSILCDGCDNLNEEGYPTVYRFRQTPPVRIRLVSVPYTVGQTTFTPRADDFNMLVSWLRRAYPTSQVIWSQTTIGALRGTPDQNPGFNASDVNARLELLRQMEWFFVHPQTRYYGLVFDGTGVGGGFMRGQAVLGGAVGSGPTGPQAQGWDNDGSYGDWYGGHEIGHMYDRQHPGFFTCSTVSQNRDDANYPYPNGLISGPYRGAGPDPYYFGFDLGDNGIRTGALTNGISRGVYDPTTWSDVMTYNCNQWISDYTYRGILSFLCGIENCGAQALAAIRQEPASGDHLLVLGTMNLTRSSVQLKDFSRLPNLRLSSRPANSPFNIVLFDGSGRTLARYPFEPKEASDIYDGEEKSALLSEVVPFIPGTKRIVILKDGVELASRAVSDNAPRIKLVSPSGAMTLTGKEATVRWWATDADGDRLTYALLYSADAGRTWQTVDAGIEESYYTVNLDELPGGDQALFRVIATDGVNTGQDDTDGVFRAPSKAPNARIISPGPNSSFSTAHTLVLVGEAFDCEDGQLDCAALQWRSDRQGALGSGRSIAVTGLQPGPHRITLEARDKSGALSVASVQIQIRKANLARVGTPAP
jgi:hypothetical protein